ncbi:hypothetical protein LEP1GSC193_4065 [Leptospira alstonii serovar Pingchang str. 80-412]|uniref:Uncharacterized protein n=2 Tax=Leptospira alstonii TaxID=28452 RepID=M6CNU2_9LEPT|nr:hypothetical protein LEP1GSC194_1165 [Leptospira alstonii serovar Sichuan str. 79601]EQA80422.1 hypothetical protein LEP1GSC193_4065 [Leptospira alstonii serovar Pingchang str. 80-412]
MKFQSSEILIHPEIFLTSRGVKLKISIEKTAYSFLSVHLNAGHSPKITNLDPNNSKFRTRSYGSLHK